MASLFEPLSNQTAKEVTGSGLTKLCTMLQAQTLETRYRWEITRAGEEPETRVPIDLRKALAAAPLAQALWADITPIARRDWILWISSAKQPETRRRRIENACAMLASGKRRVCCFGGIKWLMKNHATSGGIWLQFPTPDRWNAYLHC